MPGPPPSRNPRRRNLRPDWLQLPAGGREGDPPDWPMGRRPSRAVWARWCDLWATPQAFAWDQQGWGTRVVVARYCRKAQLAERDTATGTVMSEVRQLEDRLGLSPMAMRRLQWEIAERPAAQGDGDGAGVAHLDDYRDLYGDEAGSG